MKKSILLMLPFALGLAACSGGSPLDKGNIITPKFMERNFVNTKNPTVVEDKYEIEKVVDIGEYTLQGAALGGQVLVLADADGKTGWYSPYYNKMLVPFGEYTSGTTLYTESVALGAQGGLFEKALYFPVYGVTDEAGEKVTWHVVDEMGTEIYSVTTTVESEDAPSISGRRLAESERTDNEYYVVFIEGYSSQGYGAFSEIERQAVVYNLDGTVSRKLPYSEFEKHEKGEAYELGFYITMEDFGHPELAMTSSKAGAGTRYAFYNFEKHEYVSSFVMPAMNAYYIAGDYLVYQQRIQVEDRATSYDYFVGGNATTNQKKYDVVTARVNYVTGAVENLETKFLFSGNPAPLYDENGVYKYNLSTAQVIREDKTLDPQTYSFILDDKIGVAGDVTGINFSGLVKVGENYLDVQTNILYSGKLNEIAYLPNALVTESAIQVEGEFGFGLVDFNGKYLTPLTYKFIDEVKDGVFHAGDEFAEYYLQLAEDGSLSKISTFDSKTYIPAGTADPFDKVAVYGVEIEEDPGYEFHFVNQLTGKEYEPFEPAETDTQLGSLSQVYYAGGAVESFSVFYQTEDGKLYALQYNHVNTLGYNVLEAK